MSYLRDVIKEFEVDDTIDELDELFDYIRRNNIDETEQELIELDLRNIFVCSLSLNYLDFPYPMGTNFFSIFNPLQATNAIIPDIFRTCIMKEPDVFAHPVLSTRHSPKIKVSFEARPQDGASIVTRFQQILPANIIKAFFYFGYKSDFQNMNESSINFLEKKIENLVDKSASNEYNYTDPNTIFDELYSNDTILKSILELNTLLNNARLEKTDLTNLGSYSLNYLITYYVIAEVLIVPGTFDVQKYSNLRDKFTTSISYSDLVFLNSLKKMIKDDLTLQNFLLILQEDTIGLNINDVTIERLSKLFELAKKNNIFLIIDYALEVKNYILNVISSNLNKKTYKIKDYAKPVYYLLTKKLYCNYAKNEVYNYPELNLPDWCN